MKIGWKIIVIAALALGLTALMNRRMVQAATPQATAPVKTPPSAKTERTETPGAMSIPDTTLAINSPTPMSQRVVHYEIEAKYDAAKHTIDATEVLTYHNL